MSETKKPTDIFSAGRSIYLRRKSLREKADKLLDEAPARVRAIVESIEEEEASQPIEVAPSSPVSSG
jgi:hypothetical protein